MKILLGIDVSSAIIGVCALDADSESHDPLLLDHIDLRKIRGFWNKIDAAEAEMLTIIMRIQSSGHLITQVYVEDPVEKFRRGLSTAHTIVLLAKFNAIVSRYVRSVLGVDPNYVDASAARRAVGVPLQSKKVAGLGQKEQTFNFIVQHKLYNIEWPKKKNGAYEQFCYDRVDSYVICLAGKLGVKCNK